MNDRQALAAFAALSEPTRLGVLRHLIRCGPSGAPAGAIAQALDIAPSRLSFHLKILSEAGLTTAARTGKQVIHTASFAAMQDVVAYLLEDCCGGAAHLSACCAPGGTPT